MDREAKFLRGMVFDLTFLLSSDHHRFMNKLPVVGSGGENLDLSEARRGSTWQKEEGSVILAAPDEFDLDIHLTAVPSFGVARRGYPVAMPDTEATCFSTCSDPGCITNATCFSTCSPCQTVDQNTCVGDCTNNCPAQETDQCPQTQATCGGRECSTNWHTCAGATCEQTGGCRTCETTCVGDTCPGQTCGNC
jgi:hypothetical protein